MIASLRERRRQMLQAEILRAARVLIAEKGLAMSMDELAARVGISKPTLYGHFATKEDLIVAAIAQMLQRLLAVVETDTEGQPPLQRLLVLLRTGIAMMFEDGITSFQPIAPEIIQLVRSRPETIDCVQRLDTAVVGLIQQGIAQGSIDPSLNLTGVVLAFFALAQAPKFACLSSVTLAHPAAIANTLATIFAQGVAVRDPSGVTPDGSRVTGHA